MRICLFDDVAGGHHTSYVSGLVRAALDKVDYTLAASPEPIHGLDDGTGRWLPVTSTRQRQVLAGRRVVRQVIGAARAQDIDLFIDLYLEKSIWTWPMGGAWPRKAVHVLHHVRHYLYERNGVDRAKTLAARRRLSSFVRRGDVVAVHTKRAFDVLQSFLPPDGIIRVGFPVRTATVPRDQNKAIQEPPRRRLLFVGQVRVDKGADVLLSALRWLPDDVMVSFVGPQDPAKRALLESDSVSSRVTWIDRFVTDTELEEQLVAADLVVLPYRSSFSFYGGASGVLLSALALGRPVVMTSPLESQLPSRYEGAVLVKPDDAASLAGGIMSALSDLPKLLGAANVQGPEFTREQHSFEGYLRALLAGDKAAGPR